MEMKVCEKRVVPFVRYEKKEKKGKIYEEPVDNFTSLELKNMSCLPKMFKMNEDHIYIDDMPLTFNGGTSIKGFLCYVFDELNDDEKTKFFDRSIVIHTAVKNNNQDQNTFKKSINKRKTKERR